jgi:hypothetical protein
LAHGTGGCGGFLGVIFFGVVEGRFCWGFQEKWGAERGFWMVNSWWIGGESWWVNGRILRRENFPLFRDLFLSGCG